MQFTLEQMMDHEENRKSPSNITLADIERELTSLKPETFPKRYNVHKYWGKKPANVFRKLIEFFCVENGTVLDPFNGSGITTTEAVLSGRNGIGFDLNPFAIELTKSMLANSNIDNFKKKALELSSKFDELASELYSTNCRTCGSLVVPTSFSWAEEKLTQVRYSCSSCKNKGSFEPNDADIEKSSTRHQFTYDFPDRDMHYGWEMQKLKRRNIKKFSDLFTNRNLYLCAAIFSEIEKVKDKNLKAMLRLTFTANLAQCTRMIADSKNGGGPSWKINCYWLPKTWQELNVIHYFKNRINKTNSAIAEISSLISDRPKYLLKVADSQKLTTHIEPNSVDYILTDPPYGGEGIQYGELSMLWNLWLGYSQDLDSEVAENPYREKSLQDYADSLAKVVACCYTVLKPGCWMSVTFNNKDTKVWDALVEACRNAGFKLIAVSPLERSAPSLTEHTTNVAPKVDVLLHFQKPFHSQNAKEKHGIGSFNMEEKTIDIALREININGNITTERVLQLLTTEWLTYYYNNQRTHVENFGSLAVPFINRALDKESKLKKERASNDKKFDNYIWYVPQ